MKQDGGGLIWWAGKVGKLERRKTFGTEFTGGLDMSWTRGGIKSLSKSLA